MWNSPPLSSWFVHDAGSSRQTASMSSMEAVKIAAIVVIFIVSFFAAFFPTVAQRAQSIKVPSLLFFVGKHFGTGVILSTAFVHLLADAFKYLDGFRLAGYKNWSGLIVLLSLVSIFLIEYISTVYVENLASQRTPPRKSAPVQIRRHESEHIGHGHNHHSPHIHSSVNGRPAAAHEATRLLHRDHQPDLYIDVYMHHHNHSHSEGYCALTEEKRDRTMKLLSVLVLQAGIMLHSFVIGMTLAVTSESHLPSLLTAILFHQLFEGLSLGVRLATLPSAISSLPSTPSSEGDSPLPYSPVDQDRSISFIPLLLSFLFAITTPVGISVGLLVSYIHPTTPSSGSSTFTGVMAALSAGLLIYAGCVELLANDFVMDIAMRKASFRRQVIAILSLCCGVVAMALVGA